jgi:anti-anti-sigma factor
MATAKDLVQAVVNNGVTVATINEPQLTGDATSEKLRQQLIGLVTEAGARKIAIDLQKVQYMASAAFRPFLSLNRKLQEVKGQMVLCNLSPIVRTIFEQMRLISSNPLYHATFDAQPDVAAAVAFLNQQEPPR